MKFKIFNVKSIKWKVPLEKWNKREREKEKNTRIQRVKKRNIYIYNLTKMKFYKRTRKLNFINVDLSRYTRYRDNGETKRICVYRVNLTFQLSIVGISKRQKRFHFREATSLTRRKLDRVELADRRISAWTLNHAQKAGIIKSCKRRDTTRGGSMVYYHSDEGNWPASYVCSKTFLIKNLLREMRLPFHHGITKAPQVILRRW